MLKKNNSLIVVGLIHDRKIIWCVEYYSDEQLTQWLSLKPQLLKWLLKQWNLNCFNLGETNSTLKLLYVFEPLFDYKDLTFVLSISCQDPKWDVVATERQPQEPVWWFPVQQVYAPVQSTKHGKRDTWWSKCQFLKMMFFLLPFRVI